MFKKLWKWLFGASTTHQSNIIEPVGGIDGMTLGQALDVLNEKAFAGNGGLFRVIRRSCEGKCCVITETTAYSTFYFSLYEKNNGDWKLFSSYTKAIHVVDIIAKLWPADYVSVDWMIEKR